MLSEMGFPAHQLTTMTDSVMHTLGNGRRSISFDDFAQIWLQRGSSRTEAAAESPRLSLRLPPPNSPSREWGSSTAIVSLSALPSTEGFVRGQRAKLLMRPGEAVYSGVTVLDARADGTYSVDIPGLGARHGIRGSQLQSYPEGSHRSSRSSSNMSSLALVGQQHAASRNIEPSQPRLLQQPPSMAAPQSQSRAVFDLLTNNTGGRLRPDAVGE